MRLPAALRLERNMKGKGRGLPPNVARLRASRLGPPGTAAIPEGLELMRVFLRIETRRNRKKVLDLAKQLAPIDADAKP
jgi:hypothetical protein